MIEAIAWVDLSKAEKIDAISALLNGGHDHAETAARLSAVYGPVTTRTVRVFCQTNGLRPCAQALRVRLRVEEAGRQHLVAPPAERPEPEDAEAEPIVTDLSGGLPGGVAGGEGIGLFDLTDKTCRYPFGQPNDPPRFFCGKPTQEGSSYCPACHALTHAPLDEQWVRSKRYYLPSRVRAA